VRAQEPDTAARRARADAFVERGRRYLDAGDPGSAVGFFVDALRVDPRHEAAYLALVTAHRRRQRNDDAIAVLELALRMRPRSIPLRLARADLLVDLSRERDALQDLRVATGLDPNDGRAWCVRAEVARTVGAYTESLAAYRRAASFVGACADADRYARALLGLARETDPVARACARAAHGSAVEHALCAEIAAR
jgi:Tfp pilus assembly protein PilF